MMRSKFFAILIVLFVSSVHGSEGFLSFKDWKDQQLQKAKVSLDAAQVDYHLSKNQSPKDETSPQDRSVPSQRIQRAKLNYDVAQDLTIKDYFFLYVSELTDRGAFEMAIRKFTTSELADLLTAYKLDVQQKEQSPAAPSLRADLFSKSSVISKDKALSDKSSIQTDGVKLKTN